MSLSGALSFRAIRLTIHQSATASINNNTIRNINLTTSSQSQAASAVSMVSGSFSCHHNRVSDINYSSSGNGSWFSALNAGTGSPVNIDIGYNIIDNIHMSGNSNCSLRGITIASPNPYTAQATEINVHDNTIGTPDSGLSSNLNGTILGIISQSACIYQTISMNTIQFLQALSTGPGNQVTGISAVGNNGGSFSVTGNTVRHCTSASSSSGNSALSSVIGISCTASSTPGQRLHGNNIYSLLNGDMKFFTRHMRDYYDGRPQGITGFKITKSTIFL